MPTRTLERAAAGLFLAVLTGCSWAPQSRIDALSAENRRLAEQSRAQLAELANVNAHTERVENQLLAAQNELQQLAGVDRQPAPPDHTPRQLARGHGDLHSQLAALASQHPDWFRYDPQAGISKLDIDVLFDSGATDLKPGADKLLRDFAQALKSPAAADLKIMIVGHTDSQRIKGDARARYRDNWHLSSARALAVADRLRELGVSPDRMGVAGFGPQQPIASNSAEQTRQYNRRVEIFVAAPNVPIVGMTETLTNLY